MSKTESKFTVSQLLAHHNKQPNMSKTEKGNDKVYMKISVV